MPPKIATIVGTPTSTSWAQAHTFLNPEKEETYGSLSVCLSVKAEEEAGRIGHEILESLEQRYFTSQNESLLTLLKSSLGEVVEQYAHSSKIEMAVVVVWRSFVYFALWGNSQIILKRADNIATILKGREGQIGSCSGEIREGDIFVVGTQEFFTREGLNFLKSNVPLEQALDQVRAKAHTEVSSLLAAQVLQFGGPFGETQGEHVEDVVKSFSFSLKKMFSQILQKLPEPKTLANTSPSSRKTAVTVGVILLLILAASIWFGREQKQEQELKNSYESQLTQAEQSYAQAIEQKEINPSYSRELFLKAKLGLEELLGRQIKDSRVEDLKTKIEQDIPEILGIVDAQSQSFLDLSLIRSGIGATKMVLEGKILIILDTQGRRVISIDLEDKNPSVLGGADKLSEVKSVGFQNNLYYLLTPDNIQSLGKAGDVKTAIEKDSEWGEILNLASFGSSLYLLDKGSPSTGSGQVWKYPATETGLGSKQKWLKTTSDFSSAVDISIDGSLWVLLGNGEIKRFTRGLEDVVRIAGLEKPLNNPKAFYTDEKLESVFILDRENARIVELTKAGSYKKQYLLKTDAQVNDFVASKDVGKIFLLTDTKILELPLK